MQWKQTQTKVYLNFLRIMDCILTAVLFMRLKEWYKLVSIQVKLNLSHRKSQRNQSNFFKNYQEMRNLNLLPVLKDNLRFWLILNSKIRLRELDWIQVKDQGAVRKQQSLVQNTALEYGLSILIKLIKKLKNWELKSRNFILISELEQILTIGYT